MTAYDLRLTMKSTAKTSSGIRKIFCKPQSSQIDHCCTRLAGNGFNIGFTVHESRDIVSKDEIMKKLGKQINQGNK